MRIAIRNPKITYYNSMHIVTYTQKIINLREIINLHRNVRKQRKSLVLAHQTYVRERCFLVFTCRLLQVNGIDCEKIVGKISRKINLLMNHNCDTSIDLGNDCIYNERIECELFVLIVI